MAQKVWFAISDETFRENCTVEDLLKAALKTEQ